MILVCFGTRPEIVKIAPVVQELARRGIAHKLVFTGQHRELYQDVRSLIPEPDYHLDIMKENQSPNDVLAGIIQRMDEILKVEQAELIIVQGDTTTVLAASLAAFNSRVKIGHIEAGLRTYNLRSPFPEEANRQLVSRIADFNWAPTERAAQALHAEGVSNIFLTGNTVIDTCRGFNFEISYGDEVLITLHRRENFGPRMESHFRQIDQLAAEHPELKFIFPMHPNPNVQALRPLLRHVQVKAPLSYPEMVQLLSRARFAITDSGGIQEECAAFKKKVLVCRDTTERQESVEAGLARLVDTDILGHFAWANEDPRWDGQNPYGDGHASERIVDTIAGTSR